MDSSLQREPYEENPPMCAQIIGFSNFGAAAAHVRGRQCRSDCTEIAVIKLYLVYEEEMEEGVSNGKCCCRGVTMADLLSSLNEKEEDPLQLFSL
ncbi:hypothetical protein ACFX2A_013082 [Malus domestica]